MARILGVDPGNTGALCLFERGLPIDIVDMPVVDGRVSPQILADAIKKWTCIDQAVIEAVHSMPRQGVASTFKFGFGYGCVHGVVAALGIPVVNVSPQKWTKDLGVGSDKELHRRTAIETWPGCSEIFARKKDEGRADAALIAWWASRCWGDQ